MARPFTAGASRRHLVILLSLGSVLPCATEALAFCPNTPNNLRVMTVNVHSSDELFADTDDLYDKSVEQRMADIAERIKTVDPDVVAIVDCSENSAKDVLLQRLGSDRYPGRVEWLNNMWDGQDSGMMIFSKHPLLSFGSAYKSDDDVFIDGNSGSQSFDEDNHFVAFNYFSGGSCVGVDCQAAKMAAMVRVDTPGQCAVNVAFTHLTADYADDSGGERKKRQIARELSLGGIKHMITQTLSVAQLQTEALFLVGDLNIDGNLNPDQGDYRPLPSYHLFPNTFDPETGEWDRLFGNNFQDIDKWFWACRDDGFSTGANCFYDGSFTGPGSKLFTDPWAWEHPRSDRGQTAFDAPENQDFLDGHDNFFLGTRFLDGKDGLRYDYILHNQPVALNEFGAPNPNAHYLCLQHIRRLWWDDDRIYETVPLPSFDPQSQSDHLAVYADFGFMRSPQCSPMLRSADQASGVGPTFGSQKVDWGTSQDVTFSNILRYDRDYLWYRIDEQGTYSIGTTDNGAFEALDIRVFHNSDLSGPVPDYHHETIEATVNDVDYKAHVYSFLDPPYYVRVANNPGVVTPLSAQLLFRKHFCTNPVNDYCVLRAGDEFAYQAGWPSEKVLSWDFNSDPSCVSSNDPTCDPRDCVNDQSPYGEDHLYFAFGVDQSSSGLNPPIEFLFANTDVSKFNLQDADPGRGAQVFDFQTFDVKLPDCDGSAGPCNSPIAGGTWVMDDLNMNNDVTSNLAPTAQGTPKAALLRIHRESAGTMVDTTVTYRASVMSVDYISMTCHMEDDTNDEDEIYLYPRVDDGVLPECKNVVVAPYHYGDYDEGTSLDVNMSFEFLSGTSARICEADVTSAWDHYPIDMNHSYGPAGIQAHSNGKVRSRVFSDLLFSDMSPDDADYYYELFFRISDEDLSTTFEPPAAGTQLTCP